MKKILVVDDNKAIADMLKLILEIAGYQCTVAYSGKDCLDILSHNDFDLLLLDIAMPEFTGPDILAAIKSDPSLADNKIVFLTASSPTGDAIASLLENGALEVVKKPITEANLLRLVQKYA